LILSIELGWGPQDLFPLTWEEIAFWVGETKRYQKDRAKAERQAQQSAKAGRR